MKAITKAEDGKVLVKKKPLFFYTILIWRLKSGIIETVDAIRTD